MTTTTIERSPEAQALVERAEALRARAAEIARRLAPQLSLPFDGEDPGVAR